MNDRTDRIVRSNPSTLATPPGYSHVVAAASTLVQVVALVHPEFLIEIEAVAVVAAGATA